MTFSLFILCEIWNVKHDEVFPLRRLYAPDLSEIFFQFDSLAVHFLDTFWLLQVFGDNLPSDCLNVLCHVNMKLGNDNYLLLSCLLPCLMSIFVLKFRIYLI